MTVWGARDPELGVRLPLEEWVDHAEPVVVLRVTQVLGVDGVAALEPRGREDGAVPVREAGALTNGERLPQHLQGDCLHREAFERLDPGRRLIVGQCSRARGSSPLRL